MNANADPSSRGAPSRDDAARVERAIRATPVAWRSVPAHGAETNRRWLVELAHGRSAFVKLAVTDDAADWLRNERAIYRALDGAPFLPG